MKAIKIILTVSLLISGLSGLINTGYASVAEILDLNQPANVKNVKSDIVNTEYAIVATTIKFAKDSPPKILRSVKGKVAANRSVKADINLLIPKPKPDYAQFNNLIDGVTSILGSVNCKYGAIASGAQAILDVGLDQVSDLVARSYKISPDTMQFIEIIPTKYYRVDEKTGNIVVTPEFSTDFKKGTALQKEEIEARDKYNELVDKNEEEENKLVKKYGISWQYSNSAEVKAHYNFQMDSVKPAYEAFANASKKAAQYQLHRILLMATPLSGDQYGINCSEENAGYGPIQMNISYFIGAKQTNKIQVNYCIPNKSSSPIFDINLRNSTSDAYGNYIPAGIQFESVKNIYFSEYNPQKDNYSRSLKSDLYSWEDEMIVNEDSSNIENFLWPYDLSKLEQELKKQEQTTRDERVKAKLKKAENYIKSGKGCAEEESSGKEEVEEEQEEDTAEKEEKQKAEEAKELKMLPAPETKEPLLLTGAETKSEIKKSLGAVADNPYTILGITQKATPTEINSAYKKLALQYHPDKPGGDKELFQKLNNAKDTLLNPTKRKELDRLLATK